MDLLLIAHGRWRDALPSLGVGVFDTYTFRRSTPPLTDAAAAPRRVNKAAVELARVTDRRPPLPSF